MQQRSPDIAASAERDEVSNGGGTAFASEREPKSRLSSRVYVEPSDQAQGDQIDVCPVVLFFIIVFEVAVVIIFSAHVVGALILDTHAVVRLQTALRDGTPLQQYQIDALVDAIDRVRTTRGTFEVKARTTD